MKRYFKFLFLAPLLMASLCEEERLDPLYSYNTFSVEVSSKASYAINDTIWIEGKVSAYVFDLVQNDSIAGVLPKTDGFSIMELVESNTLPNSQDALDKFIPIYSLGGYSFIRHCENSEVMVTPLLNQEETQYSYRIGFRAMKPGDYYISLSTAELINDERHLSILKKYELMDRPVKLRPISCEDSSQKNVSDSGHVYFFTVE